MGPAPITAKLIAKAEAQAKKQLMSKDEEKFGRLLTPNSDKHAAPITKAMANRERNERKNQNFIQPIEIVTFLPFFP